MMKLFYGVVATILFLKLKYSSTRKDYLCFLFVILSSCMLAENTVFYLKFLKMIFPYLSKLVIDTHWLHIFKKVFINMAA